MAQNVRNQGQNQNKGQGQGQDRNDGETRQGRGSQDRDSQQNQGSTTGRALCAIPFARQPSVQGVRGGMSAATLWQRVSACEPRDHRLPGKPPFLADAAPRQGAGLGERLHRVR